MALTPEENQELLDLYKQKKELLKSNNTALASQQKEVEKVEEKPKSILSDFKESGQRLLEGTKEEFQKGAELELRGREFAEEARGEGLPLKAVLGEIDRVGGGVKAALSPVTSVLKESAAGWIELAKLIGTTELGQDVKGKLQDILGNVGVQEIIGTFSEGGEIPIAPVIGKGVVKTVEAVKETPGLTGLAEIGSGVLELEAFGARTLPSAISKSRKRIAASKTAARLKRFDTAKARLATLQKSQKTVDVADIKRIAADAGITDLPASATGSDLTARIEGALGEGFFGREFKEEAQQAITKFEDFTAGIAKQGKTKEALGQDIARVFSNAKQAEDDMIKSLYKQAEAVSNAGGKSIVVDATGTAKMVDKLIDRELLVVEGLQNKRKIARLESLKEALKTDVNVSQAEATREKIGDLARFDRLDRTTDDKDFGSIYNIFKDEIGDSITKVEPKFGVVLDDAKAKFAQVKGLEKRAFFRQIRNFTDKQQFDKIINTFASPASSVTDVRDAYAFLGKVPTENIQKSLISDIIRKAKGADDSFTLQGFSKQFKSLGEEKMKVLFTKQQLKQLKDFDTLNQALARSQRVAGGSQTAQVQAISNFVRGGLALGTGGTSLLAEFGFSKFFRTTRGKKILEGLGSAERRKVEKLIKEVEVLGKKIPPTDTPKVPVKSLEAEQGLAKAGIAPKSTTTEGIFSESNATRKAKASTLTESEIETLKKRPQKEVDIGIERDQTLDADGLLVQDASIKKYLKDKESLAGEYINKFDKKVNTDDARTLFRDVGYEGTNSPAVHEASSRLAKDVWEIQLNKNPEEVAAFYAGGSGSGKSTGIKQLDGGLDNVAVVHDSNMNNYGKAIERFEKARKAGKEIDVTYVYRDPIEAFENGTIKRMLGTTEPGRVIPIDIHVETHTGSLNVIKRLIKEGKVDNSTLINNSFGKNKAKIMTPDELNNLKMPANLKQTLIDETKRLLESGKINEEQFKAIMGANL